MGHFVGEFFDKEEISDKLVTGGNTQVKDGAIKLTDGSISLKNKSRYYIADFTLLNQTADLNVSFSDNKSIILSKDLKKATVKDGSKKTDFDLSAYNLSDYKNAQIQLILQYDALSVAVNGIYEPNDKFASPIVEYTFDKPVAEGILKWSSKDSLIDDISVFFLDHSYKAASVGYDQDPNDTDIWVKKDTIINKPDSKVSAESDKGIPTLFIVIYSVIGAIILALLVVIVTLRKKKRGKDQ